MTEPAIPQLVAHRGLMASCPENSRLALDRALRAGACWVEFDVQRCDDGDFVVLHDEDLERTSDRRGSIFAMTREERTAISVHEPARFGQRFFPTPLPTLEEALLQLRRYPKARAMVEIKEESLRHHGLGPVMRPLLAALQPFREQCLLISFSADAVAWARHHSELQTGWVLQHYDNEHLQQAVGLAPDILICNHRKLPPGDTPPPGSWKWMLYDIGDPELALQWAACGVQLIETGDIATMLRHPQLARRRC